MKRTNAEQVNNQPLCAANAASLANVSDPVLDATG